jgi:hypothetical protein
MKASFYKQFGPDSLVHADGQRYTMGLGVVKRSSASKATHSGFGIVRPRSVNGELAQSANGRQNLNMTIGN